MLSFDIEIWFKIFVPVATVKCNNHKNLNTKFNTCFTT